MGRPESGELVTALLVAPIADEDEIAIGGDIGMGAKQFGIGRFMPGEHPLSPAARPIGLA